MESINHDLQASYSVIKLLEGSNINSERVFQSLPGIFAIINRNDQILRGNETVAAHLSLEREDMLRQPFSNLFHQENWNLFSHYLAQLRDPSLKLDKVEFELGIDDPDMISGTRVHYWYLRKMNVVSKTEGELIIIIGEDISQLRESEQKLNEIFASIPLGIFTVNCDGKIEAYRSSYLDYLLDQKEFTGRSIKEVLFEPAMDTLTEAEKEGVVSLDFVLGQGSLTFDMLEPFFPKQIFFPIPGLEDNGRWLKIRYQPVVYEETVKRLLIILEDRTEIVKTREMTKKARMLEDQSVQRVFQLKQIDSKGLHLYIKELHNLVKRLHEERASQASQKQLFATTHGIKGIARVAGFTFLKEIASDLESEFQRSSQQTADTETKKFDELFREFSSLFALYQAIYPQVSTFRRTADMGFDTPAENDSLGLLFSQYNTLLNAPSSLNKTLQIDQLFFGMLSYRYTFANTLEEGLQTQAEVTAKSLGKQVKIQIDWGNVLIKAGVLSALNECLIHLINNAIDHGIETPDKRKELNKDPMGHITILVSEKDSVLTCEITDDGAGIDSTKIREAAVLKGVKTTLELAEMDEDEILQLILHPGLTTAKTLSDTSGRGIGMEAVAGNLEKFRGAIHIESTKGIGSTFQLTFNLIGRDDLQLVKRCHPLSYFKQVVEEYLTLLAKEHGFDIELVFDDRFEKGIFYGDLVKAIVCFASYLGSYACKGKLAVRLSLAQEFYIRCVCKVTEPAIDPRPLSQFDYPLQLCKYFILKDNGMLIAETDSLEIQIPCFFHAKGAPKLVIGYTQKVDQHLAKSTFTKIKEVAAELDVTVEFSSDKEAVNMLIYPSATKNRNQVFFPHPGFTVSSSHKMIRQEMLRGLEQLLQKSNRIQKIDQTAR